MPKQSVYVFHQCRADSAGTCGEFLEVSDYLRSKTDLIEVYAEDRVVVEKRSDGCFNIFVFSELDFCHYRLYSSCQRIGGDLEDFAFIVDTHHVAEPAGLDQRDEFEVRDIEILSFIICLDGLAKADRKLLRGIGCDSLRRVRHEGVGNSDIEDSVDELLGITRRSGSQASERYRLRFSEVCQA